MPSHIIDAFADRSILVVGEAILDSYVTGYADRLCAEAPVPVVTLGDRQDVPGGAANVAVNLRSLGAQVTLLSVIGADAEGDRLRQALADRGVATDHLLVQPGRRTLVKQRITAGSQLLLRLDQGSTEAIVPKWEQALCDRLRSADCDAIIISDYGYGVFTPGVLQTIAALQAESPRLLLADSKRLGSFQTVSPTVVKPNYAEAIQLLGLPSQHPALDAEPDHRIHQIAAHSESLLDRTGAQIAVVTLDTAGAVILQRQQAAQHCPAYSHPCTSPIGAGDTFISALTLALATDASVTTATELAIAAAAIAVGKEGTATCTAAELQTLLPAASTSTEGWWSGNRAAAPAQSEPTQEVA